MAEDDRTVVLELERREGEKLILSKRTFKGQAYIDLRIFYKNDGGEWLPTKKGVSLRPEQVSDVAKAFQGLADEYQP